MGVLLLLLEKSGREMSMARTKKLSFEEALASLESIVGALENSDISLAELLDKYTEGVKLSEACLQELQKAEQTIDIMVQEKNGGLEKTALQIEGE
jgi:exodeoxyribonuclease VII small subunit